MSDSTLNILVDLDSVMDTRLPVVYTLDPELAATIVADRSYFTRFKDEFKHIPRDMFRSLYNARSKAILNLATPTKMLATLSDYCGEAIYQDKKLGGTGELIVYLNIYPYNLTSEECDNLASGIRYSIGDVDVKTVSMSNSELLPAWVDQNLAAMILYDGLEWLEYHTAMKTIIDCPLVDIALMVPTMAVGNIKTVGMPKDILRKTFLDMESMSKTLIKLMFIDVIDFCGLLDKKKTN